MKTIKLVLYNQEYNLNEIHNYSSMQIEQVGSWNLNNIFTKFSLKTALFN